MKSQDVDIAVIGAGIVGLAAAYFLSTRHGRTRLLIVDTGQPMTLTSAKSGENYRNWWPHPTMTEFTDHSIGLMEEIARRTDNRIHMTRRGYLLATRNPEPDKFIEQLYVGYGAAADRSIRIHDGTGSKGYQPPLFGDWESAPIGVDVLLDKGLVHHHFPYLDPDIATLLHVRRAGDISGQQMGQYMLEEVRQRGGRFQQACVTTIARDRRFKLELDVDGTVESVSADVIVNASQGDPAAAVQKGTGGAHGVLVTAVSRAAFAQAIGMVRRRGTIAIHLQG